MLDVEGQGQRRTSVRTYLLIAFAREGVPDVALEHSVRIRWAGDDTVLGDVYSGVIDCLRQRNHDFTAKEPNGLVVFFP